jgi:hypothetical protein
MTEDEMVIEMQDMSAKFPTSSSSQTDMKDKHSSMLLAWVRQQTPSNAFRSSEYSKIHSLQEDKVVETGFELSKGEYAPQVPPSTTAIDDIYSSSDQFLFQGEEEREGSIQINNSSHKEGKQRGLKRKLSQLFIEPWRSQRRIKEEGSGKATLTQSKTTTIRRHNTWRQRLRPSKESIFRNVACVVACILYALLGMTYVFFDEVSTVSFLCVISYLYCIDIPLMEHY